MEEELKERWAIFPRQTSPGPWELFDERNPSGGWDIWGVSLAFEWMDEFYKTATGGNGEEGDLTGIFLQASDTKASYY